MKVEKRYTTITFYFGSRGFEKVTQLKSKKGS